MDAAFRTDRERRKTRLKAHRVREELVDGHIALGAILRLRVQHARKERMHREVPTLHAVVEPAEGMLACGYEGVGKLAPVEEIVARVLAILG